MTRRPSILAALLVLLATCSFTAARQNEPLRAQVSTAINQSALQKGQRAVIAVVLDIADGFHSQSHTPIGEGMIATEVAFEANPHVTFLEPVYPPGKDQTYAVLGTLNVYTGKAIIYVPVEVKPDAPAGALSLTGSITYQTCDDNVCFAPETTEFKIDTRVAATADAVTANSPELFAGYDPTNVATPATRPATGANASATPVRSTPAAPWGIPVALGVAFVAGILFNIVPCVLPVLPIKVLGFAEVAQHNRGRTVALATVFGAGIVTVFAVLAVLILVLKTISWGQQFSNPIFAWGIVGLLLIMSLWLFGVLNINLPPAAYAFTPRHDTMFGNYLWGILTAILSTPCTGPLFPPIMLWAQAQPTIVGVPAMMTVGVGMAFPYVVLSAFPEAARKFPRVGPWAELFKQMLGFILLAFTVWFAAGRFTSPQGQWWSVVPVAVLAALYLMARTVQLSKDARPVAIASALAVIMLTSSVLLACRFSGVFDERSANSASTTSAQWTPYSHAALAAARDANKIVLVKFTANWCLNCQYVEATVYHDQKALDALRKRGAVMLKADLTSNRALGWPLLKQLNPSGGIPLTAIYPPGQAEPIQLASIYTVSELIKALDQATAKPEQRASTAR